MPPPKKPKNGPTTVEQFLSREELELQRMEETSSGMAPSSSSPSSSCSPPTHTGTSGSGGGCSGSGDGKEGENRLVSVPSASSSPATGARTESSATSCFNSVVLRTGGETLHTSDPAGSRFRLLRQLFVLQEPEVESHCLPATSLPAAPTRTRFAKCRNGDRVLVPESGRSADCCEHWPMERSSGSSFSSGGALHRPSASFQPVRSASDKADSGNNMQGDGTVISKKNLVKRTYLTSLIKDCTPASSGAMAASYLERAALTSGKLLQSVKGAPAAPKYIHAAFQLPLMDTSTSGQAVTGPISTSMLAYLAAQGAHHHPHSPLPTLPPLPRCCGPSSLPLVDTSTSLTSFSPSLSSSSSFTSSSASGRGVFTVVPQMNEPFDLSVKKLVRLGGSLDSDSAGSDKTSGDLTSSSSPPGSGTAEMATGVHLPSVSLTSSSSTSPAVANTPAVRGGERDGCTSPALPRTVARAPYLMDLRPGGVTTDCVLGRLAHDVAGVVLNTAAVMAHGAFPATGHSSCFPNKEPSDIKASGGDISQGHNHLESGVTSGPTGASPGEVGAGPGPSGVLGMPSHSIMSTSGHLQAPTSTTPESSGLGVAPSFFPMEPHLRVSDIKQEIPAGSSTPAKLCQVCNDNASGFHYGVWSCEGCKAFFKRSIQGPVDYMCPATNNCTIDKHRRKSCQACRLRKCYEVGMNKGSQRKDRKSSGGSSTPKGKRCRADSTDVVNSTSGAGSSKNAKLLQSGPILEALKKADLPVLESYHNHNHPLDRVHLLNTLIKLADQELVFLINWAKHVPGYTDLSLSDQVHLIECCWMELLLLNCAFRSMEYEGRRLVFAPDFHLDRPLWVVMGMTEILEQVSAVTEQMVQYAVTKEELLLLKATILVNAEVRRLASFSKIIEMRQMIVDALTEVAQKSHPEDTRRVPSLLLLLTHVRQAGERGIAYFQTLKRGGCVAFCDLLTEMLDAHNSAMSTASVASSVAMTASLPSTSSTGTDQKTLNLAPSHLPQGPS
ncbi:uncharacterized protein LOC143296332 [Babylonia areolata]|uniref:uncharacterized protein LOC143296332 n=1 Tax=Babylonia areolata TaxID=304850 RepID=UPI003FD5EBBA